MTSFEKLSSLYKILLLISILFFLIDISIVFIARKNNIPLQNRYYMWHIKFGFSKVTAIKFGYILWLAYILLYPPGNAGSAGVAAIVYCFAVVTLVASFVKEYLRKIRG